MTEEQPEINKTTLDKVLFGTTSIFENVCVYEHIDPQLLFNIIHTAELIKFDNKRYADGVGKLYKTERDLLIAYQYQWVAPINRFVSEWYLPKHGWGRILPRDYLSMSVFHRPTRHTLCNEKLIDLDLVNCHFEIVLNYMKDLNIPCDNIAKYCGNVSHYREEIMKFYGVSKDAAKGLFIRLIYGGSLVGWKTDNAISTFEDPDILADIGQELNEFIEIVWAGNQHIYNDIVKHNPNFYKGSYQNKNKKSVMAFWCQSIERYIQEQTILYLCNTYDINVKDCIPCQDGFMMLKEHFHEEFIEKINTFIKTINYTSTFIRKPFNERYKVGLPSINHIYHRFSLKDIADAQFAQLLIEVAFKYNEIITTGDSKHLDTYMYNGIYWEKLSTHNAEFHKGRIDYLEAWCLEKLVLLHRVFVANYTNRHSKIKITDLEILDLKTTIKDLSKQITQLRKLTAGSEDLKYAISKMTILCLLEVVEKEISKARANILSLSRCSVRNSIIDIFIGKLHKSEILWDTNPELFAFNNGIFDLSIGDFIKPVKEQYIKTTCGWNWDYEYDNTRVETIQELVTSILPDKLVHDYYLTYMSLGLSGNKVQRLVINTGTGGNGKSLLRELLNKTAGKYSMKIPTDVVCESIKASGANPIIASMDGMRTIYFSEPNSRQKLCAATIKEITGDSKIVGRHLYSTKSDVNIIATISADTNKVPSLDDNDPVNKDSILRRLVVIPFKTTAVTQEVYDAAENKTYLNIKKNYAENSNWINEYKQAYFIILLHYYHLYKTIPNILDMIPNECQDRTSTYLNASCDIMSWINDEMVRVDIDKSDTIALKDIYTLFKSNDRFKTFNKQDQRTYCQKYFINLLKSSKQLSPFIIESGKYHNKIRATHDCLIGYKYINDETDNTNTSNL